MALAPIGLNVIRCGVATVFCGLLAWVAPLPAATPIADDRGVQVLLPVAPQRIVSVLPSLTETVCVLGACDRLVGVDRYSNWPAQVGRLPTVGGGIAPSLEAVLALKPDLVLAAKSTRGLDRIEAMGIPVAALEPTSLADMRSVIDRIAQLVNAPPARAESVWAGLEASLSKFHGRLRSPDGVPPKVYVEVSDAPYAAGEASFIGELLAVMGAKNIVPSTLGPFPKISPEFVVRAQPDLIVVTTAGRPLDTRPGWKAIPAIQTGRVCRPNSAQADVVVRPGPRLEEAMDILLACAQGRLP